MSTKENNIQYNTLFMVFMFVVGLVLIYSGWTIDTSLKDCNSQALKNSNKIILILGSMLVALSVAYFKCTSECPAEDRGMALYLILTTILGIALIVLGAIISAHVNSSNNPLCQGKNGNIVWVLGTLMVVGSGIIIYKNVHFDKKFFSRL